MESPSEDEEWVDTFIAHNAVALAESEDGVTWHKPLVLQPSEIPGGRWHRMWRSVPANGSNVVSEVGQWGLHVASEGVPGAPYIAGTECRPRTLHRWARWADVCAAQSEDGINWKQVCDV